MKFKNALDIMLFRAPEEEVTLAEIDKVSTTADPTAKEVEVRKLEKPKVRNKAFEAFLGVFGLSASDAYARTREQVRINSEKAIREEASEILEKALGAIEFAISEEKFKTEIGGPGRPSADTDPYVFKRSYSEYRADSKECVCEHLRKLGYVVTEVEGISVSIDWSQSSKDSLKSKVTPAPSKPETEAQKVPAPEKPQTSQNS